MEKLQVLEANTQKDMPLYSLDYHPKFTLNYILYINLLNVSSLLTYTI